MPSDWQRYCEKADLGEKAVSLDEFLEVAVNLPLFAWTTASLQELARSATDYGDDNGIWRDLGLTEAADDASNEILLRIHTLVGLLIAVFGHRAAAYGLNELRDQYRG
jgi:hypothetical protein